MTLITLRTLMEERNGVERCRSFSA